MRGKRNNIKQASRLYNSFKRKMFFLKMFHNQLVSYPCLKIEIWNKYECYTWRYFNCWNCDFQNVQEKILKGRANKSGKGRLGTNTTWGNNLCWIINGSHVPQHTVFKFCKSLHFNLLSWSNIQVQKSINRLKGHSMLTHTMSEESRDFLFHWKLWN